MQQDVLEGFRLSPLQKRLWLLAGDRPDCVCQCVVRIDGELREAALRAAIEGLCRRHESLRTTFHRLPGMEVPVQVVEPAPAYLLELGAAAGEEDAERLLDCERRRSFDPGRLPLLRLLLCPIAPERHLLVITAAALCADRRSLRNLVQELGTSLADGAAAAEPPGEMVQYIDFSEWQHGVLEEADREDLELWRRQEHGAPPLPELPGERSAAAARDGERVRLEAEPWLAERIDTVGGLEQGAVLMAAWYLLLSRLGGGTDLVIDCLVDGRRVSPLARAVGLFEKHVPLRLPVEEDFRFAELVTLVQHAYATASLNQDGYLPTEPPSGGRLLSRVAFELLDLRHEESNGAVRMHLLDLEARAERFKLRLSAMRTAAGWRLTLASDLGAFDRDVLERLGERLLTILAAALRSPEARLGDLEILGPAERRRLLKDRGRGTVASLPATSVQQLFEAQVDRTPEAVAVLSGEQQLSFRELDERANRLAWRLRDLGVGPEERVGLCCGRSVDLVAAVIATLKAGGAFVPMDPQLPRERLAYLARNAGLRVVVMEEGGGAALPEEVARVVLRPAGEDLAGNSGARPAVQVSPESLAYVLYTSGSTGRPKGALIRHRSVMNLAFALRSSVYEGGGEGLRVSMNAPLSFDASIKQVLQLLWGHALVLVPEDVRRGGEELLRFVTEKRLDVVDCTPPQLELLLAAGLLDRISSRRFLVGGEAIGEGPWRALASRPEIAFWNVYGPTECTVDTTACRIGEVSSPSIGRPLANVRLYVVEPEWRLAPEGSVGELWIGGEGLARGYLGRSDLTAERFVPDPFSGGRGERLYRTGDRVRWGEAAGLEFVGRMDHQVKVRGVRVELGEIESVLLEHESVAAAVVVQVRRGEEQRLVGYVAPRRRTEGLYRLPNGLWVAQQNRNETDYLYEEIFVKQIYLGHGVTLPEDACVFDVGANIGLFTLFVKQCCAGSRVYAFEPVAPIFATLEANVRAYGDGVRLFAHGLSDREGSEEFLYYPHYSMMSGVARYAVPSEEVEVVKRYLLNEGSALLLEDADELLVGRFEGNLVECRQRRLSQALREEGVERIDLLKVDVQRAELAVLRGIDEEDWERIDQIVMEVHDAPGGQCEGRLSQLGSLLASHGYRVEVEQDELLAGTDRYNLYAQRSGRRPGRIGQGTRVPQVEEPELEAGALREYLRQRLPEVMVPSALVMLDRLPLTRHGKVDRSALPEPEELERRQGEACVAPRTPFEDLLAALFADVLRMDRVGVEESFFDLGGHSLLATQLMSRLREAFRVEMPLRALFEASTVAELALRVEEALGSGKGGETAPPLVPVPRDQELPLSFAQQRLWFLDQLTPGSAAYNIPAAILLSGTLNASALERAFSELVCRHEVLRCRFVQEQGRPRVAITPAGRISLPLVDLSALRAPARDLEAERLSRETALTPFDLAQGPLWRICLVRLASREHLALMTMHHAVSDAWSIGVMLPEITELYSAFAAGGLPSLPELPIQYVDFAVWQRRWLQGEVLAAELAHWRRRLDGTPPLLALPTDRPRPAVRSDRGAWVSFTLAAPLVDRLRRVTREAGVTLFMTMLAAFEVLLSRYTGRPDIPVGTPIAGRNRIEIEGLIGFFINTLVLRVDLGGAPAFGALLARVREVALEAHAHQEVPFEKLVDELQVERALSHSALFQVLFVLQNAPRGELKLPGLELRAVASDSGTAKFDLTLSVSESGEQLAGLVGYNRDLFDGVTIERLVQHWTVLLEAAAGAPERPVTRLPMLSPAEQQQLGEWAEALNRRPCELAVHELFELQAARTPEAVAVAFEGDRLLYRDLDRRANQLARYLGGLGVGRESPVGILLDRTPAMVVAVLGVLKAGAAYVPLQAGQPSERLKYMLRDTGAGVVLTSGALAPALPEGPRVLRLDLDWELVAAEEVESPGCAVALANSAYVLYTSGSTGVPKGVVIEHRQLLSYLEGVETRLGLVAGASYAMLQPLSVDSCATVLFPPLISGGCLHLISEERALNAEALGESFQRAGIDCLKIAPSHLAALLAATAAPGRLMPRRWLVIGGEALHWELARSLPVPDGCKLFNHYGPTETTVGITAHRLRVGMPAAHHSATVPLGRPLGGARLSVLDGDLQEVAIGVPGELYAGGGAVARGYLRRPALTAERFVPDPLGREAGGRLYRTGDRVRWLPDGTLEFLGRFDQQVKIRGFRIELGEIAAVLEQHPQIAEVVVMARQSPEQGQRLVAYFVAEAGGAPAERTLREYLAARLPDYMLPASLVELRALPRTPHGKVDLQALPQAASPEAELEEETAQPRNPIESALASIWAQVLGRERVGIHDNFFRLGGDSIQSIQIVARANAVGMHLTPRQMFEHQTVAELAAAAGSAPAISAEQGLVTGPVHLTPIQQRFFEMDCPELHHWNFGALLRVDPKLDGDLLPRVTEALLRHHDALRLRFVREAEGWRQWIAAADAAVPVSVLDVSQLDPPAREAIEVAAAAVQRSFDLARGPLLRVVRFRLGRGEADRLLVTAHHLVIDAVSWRILLEDMLTVWRQLSARAEPLLPPKTTSFKSWAQRLAEHAGTATVREDLPFWLGAAARVPLLPRDHASGSNTVGSVRILSNALGVEATHALLVRVPGVYQTQINDVLLAALLQAFVGWTGERSLVVDLEGHGREEIVDGVDVVRTVGWFTTVFPVRLRAERIGDPGVLLKSVKEQLRATPNRGIGYSLLRYLSPDEGVRRSLSDLPQAEVSFNYLGQFDGALAQAALLTPAPESRGATLSPRATRRYLIDVNARVTGGELHVDWAYSENVHREATIESLAQGFHLALEGLISHCLSPEAGGFTPADFPHIDLSQGELDQLLAQMEEQQEPADE
jgi:amino acid adenylation domain-containing protein/non-ribosomal peptide synthase protein (TIGR01720 family)/FkbM family methyltransferase